MARCFRPTTSSADTRSLCVSSLTTGRAFATYPCGVRTTIDEIILNLNVRGEEERKRMVLASSMKRADTLHHHEQKYKTYVMLTLSSFLLFLRLFVRFLLPLFLKLRSDYIVFYSYCITLILCTTFIQNEVRIIKYVFLKLLCSNHFINILNTSVLSYFISMCSRILSINYSNQIKLSCILL